MLIRKFKTYAKSWLHFMFVLGQRLGFNILPKHFYSSVPDISELRGKSAWRTPSSMAGVQGSAIGTQTEFAADCITAETSQVLKTRRVHHEAIVQNGSDGGYGEIEAEFLYAFIRRWKPARVVQVGCGVSTAVIIAAGKDANYTPEIICVDPYPTDYLKAQSKSGLIKLIAEPAQEVDISVFTQLQAGDLLFIDSTHAVKPGSEVNRMVLEVLPLLSAGVFVHFHDIYFPYDYPRRVISADLFFHVESTLVQAFLACNSRYRIEACLSMLHYGARDKLKEFFPHYDAQGNVDGLAAAEGTHFPSALWLRCTSD